MVGDTRSEQALRIFRWSLRSRTGRKAHPILPHVVMGCVAILAGYGHGSHRCESRRMAVYERCRQLASEAQGWWIPDHGRCELGIDANRVEVRSEALFVCLSIRSGRELLRNLPKGEVILETVVLTMRGSPRIPRIQNHLQENGISDYRFFYGIHGPESGLVTTLTCEQRVGYHRSNHPMCGHDLGTSHRTVRVAVSLPYLASASSITLGVDCSALSLLR